MSENLRLELSKVVRASRARTFEAWTRPELLMQWFGPGQMLPANVEMDARLEGAFRFVIVGISPRSGEQMKITFTGVFREFVDGEKLGFDWTVAGDPGDPTYVTVEFLEAAGGTEVRLTHEKIPAEELLKRNQLGWGMMLEKLAGLPVFAEERATAQAG
jgi:uncharacterized protein YndB with AHSA1/START domain